MEKNTKKRNDKKTKTEIKNDKTTKYGPAITSSPEFVPNPPKRQKRKRLQLRLDKLDRIASGVSDTVDAVLALLVPGHEASAKRKREDRIPLDQTLIAFSVASGIVAAILSI